MGRHHPCQRLQACKQEAEMEVSQKDPASLPITGPKNWLKNFEANDEYF